MELGSPTVLGRGLGLQKVQTDPCLSSAHITSNEGADQSRRSPNLGYPRLRNARLVGAAYAVISTPTAAILPSLRQ